jgi:hypothetical protein
MSDAQQYIMMLEISYKDLSLPEIQTDFAQQNSMQDNPKIVRNSSSASHLRDSGRWT